MGGLVYVALDNVLVARVLRIQIQVRLKQVLQLSEAQLA